MTVAQEAERKLSELQENYVSQDEVEGLKNQLQEQENIRVSLEEKIKQLTKLILVSTSVNGQGEGAQTLAARFRSGTQNVDRRMRRSTNSFGQLLGVKPQLPLPVFMVCVTSLLLIFLETYRSNDPRLTCKGSTITHPVHP